MLVLGIESSCDETAAAVVRDDGTILSNIISSQIRDHERYGGVVPEIAARAHMDGIIPIIDLALNTAGISLNAIDGVAATCGPGLIGGVIVGMTAGKAVAAALGKPFIGVNHLEGHVLSARLSDGIPFPYLVLLISGAHTQLLIAHGLGRYEMLGTTLDDAAGECFDKVGRMLGLPFPGGKHVSALASSCPDRAEAARRFPLPRPMKGRKDCDFSFSGLKTAVLKYCDGLSPADAPYLAAAMEDAAADTIADRTERAVDVFSKRYPHADKHLVSGGGVAANRIIQSRLYDLTDRHEMVFTAPPADLCTDNAAMIAWAGIERLSAGLTDPLDCSARPRWPLGTLEGPAEKG